MAQPKVTLEDFSREELISDLRTKQAIIELLEQKLSTPLAEQLDRFKSAARDVEEAFSADDVKLTRQQNNALARLNGLLYS